MSCSNASKPRERNADAAGDAIIEVVAKIEAMERLIATSRMMGTVVGVFRHSAGSLFSSLSKTRRHTREN